MEGISVDQMRGILKNMSGQELAQAQNTVINSDEDVVSKCVFTELVSEELSLRKTEGLGRKTERFMNRHGDKVAKVAIGAVLAGLGINAMQDD